MPVTICEFCPEFIPEFVDAHRGLEVMDKVQSATNAVIACMKKKLISDPEINKQFKHIAATEPWILSKASQIEAGIDKNNETPKKAFSYTS